MESPVPPARAPQPRTLRPDAGGDRAVPRPRSPDQPSGERVCLPPEVERLLLEAVNDGFVLYCCGPKNAPFALVASYQWENYVDLATIRCFDRITTARIPAPRRRRIDVFAPDDVVWAYEGSPQRALRALLDLVHPEHVDAPASTNPAPLSLQVPRAQQRPMTIQLPMPRRVGARAARLAATMAAEALACSSAPLPVYLSSIRRAPSCSASNASAISSGSWHWAG